MVNVGKSAKLYQERRQPYLRTTFRGPGPQINLADNEVHNLKLEPPLPDPNLLLAERGCSPVPDAGKTQVWPYGDKYET